MLDCQSPLGEGGKEATKARGHRFDLKDSHDFLCCYLVSYMIILFNRVKWGAMIES